MSKYRHKKEIYNFLAQKMLISDSNREEILFFWIDLYIQEFEQKHQTRFDSEDRALARKAIGDWYHSNLLETIHKILISNNIDESGINRIKNAVLFRAKYIMRDLLFRNPKKKKDGKGKEEPAVSWIENQHISSSDPEKQDYMFPSSEFEGEGVYLRREMINELMKSQNVNSLKELLFKLARQNCDKSQKILNEYIDTLRDKANSFSVMSDKS